MVPASIVINEMTSTPDAVSAGALSPGHLTDECHVVVFAPPFVIISVTVPAAPEAGGLVKLTVRSSAKVKD